MTTPAVRGCWKSTGEFLAEQLNFKFNHITIEVRS